MKLIIKGKVNPPKPKIDNFVIRKSVVDPFYAKRHGRFSRITGWMLPEKSYKPDETGVLNFIADSLGLRKYEEVIEREAKSSTYALEAASNVLLEITSGTTAGRDALTKMMRVDKSSVKQFLSAVLNRINVDIEKQGRPLLAFEPEEPYEPRSKRDIGKLKVQAKESIVPIISTTAKAPKEPYEMARQNIAPPLLKFTDMKELGQIYFNEFVKSEIKDPQGDTIVFAPRDFLHITKLDTGTADQYRCERILWIKDIIQNPDLIVKDRRDPAARLFLKWFQGEPYLFICRVTGDHRFHSVTAYPLESPGKLRALLSQEKVYTRPGFQKDKTETAPQYTPEIDKFREQAKRRIEEWRTGKPSLISQRSQIYSDDQIIMEGYQWRHWAHKKGSGWDWAMWEEIQKLAQSKGFQYKEKLTKQDLLDNPTIPDFENVFSDELSDEVTTEWRNKPRPTVMWNFVNSIPGQVWSIRSKRELWAHVKLMKDEDIKSNYPGLVGLKSAKNWEEALDTNIDIYRGIPEEKEKEELYRKRKFISYSVLPAIADKFARGYYYSYDKGEGTGVVVKRTVKFKDIIGFVNNDGENEVLVRPPKTGQHGLFGSREEYKHLKKSEEETVVPKEEIQNFKKIKNPSVLKIRHTWDIVEKKVKT